VLGLLVHHCGQNEDEDEDEDDPVVRLRRAEAYAAIGKFDEAFQDINLVLKKKKNEKKNEKNATETSISTEAGEKEDKAMKAILTKAKKLSQSLNSQLHKSDHELKSAMSKGLSKGTFSSERSPSSSLSEKGEDSNDSNDANMSPYQQHLKGKWAAERLANESSEGHKLKTIAVQEFSQSPSEALKASSSESKTDFDEEQLTKKPPPLSSSKSRFDLNTVHSIQDEQLAIFASSEIQSQLNKLRIAADFEEQRLNTHTYTKYELK